METPPGRRLPILDRFDELVHHYRRWIELLRFPMGFVSQGRNESD